jgi:hypothetical protein
METPSRTSVLYQLDYIAKMRANAAASASFRDDQAATGYDPDFCFYVRLARRGIERLRRSRGVSVSEFSLPWL